MCLLVYFTISKRVDVQASKQDNYAMNMMRDQWRANPVGMGIDPGANIASKSDSAWQ